MLEKSKTIITLYVDIKEDYMELFKTELETNEASIFFVGDIHEGSANHNEKAFDKCIEYIANRKKECSVKTFLMGDLAECINVKDKRFNPVSICEKYKISDLKDLPRKQMQIVYEKLKPIKNTIDYIIIGNHSENYVKYNLSNIYEYFCMDLLKLSYKSMLGFLAMGRIIVKQPKGKSNISIRTVLSHGVGGGGYREGYSINNIMDIFRSFDCDLHIIGHTHKLLAKPFEYETIDINNKYSKIIKWYGNSGCFMDRSVIGHRGYFEGHKGMLSEIGFLEFKIKRYTKGWHTELIEHQWLNERYEL